MPLLSKCGRSQLYVFTLPFLIWKKLVNAECLARNQIIFSLYLFIKRYKPSFKTKWPFFFIQILVVSFESLAPTFWSSPNDYPLLSDLLLKLVPTFDQVIQLPLLLGKLLNPPTLSSPLMQLASTSLYTPVANPPYNPLILLSGTRLQLQPPPPPTFPCVLWRFISLSDLLIQDFPNSRSTPEAVLFYDLWFSCY